MSTITNRIQERKGDVLSTLYPGSRVIVAHCVNAQGKMGSGIAKTIRDRFPDVYESYRDSYVAGELRLGHVETVEVFKHAQIANICGQEFYGYDGKKYVSYDALDTAFVELNHMIRLQSTIDGFHYTLAVPLLGCDRAGGNWDVVSSIIESRLSPEINIELWRL